MKNYTKLIVYSLLSLLCSIFIYFVLAQNIEVRLNYSGYNIFASDIGFVMCIFAFIAFGFTYRYELVTDIQEKG